MRNLILAAAVASLMSPTICNMSDGSDAPAGGGAKASAKAKSEPAPDPAAQAAETETAQAAGEAPAAAEQPPATPEGPSLADPASLGMAKLVPPAGASGVSWGGQNYEVGEDGHLVAPLAAVADLQAFGYTVA